MSEKILYRDCCGKLSTRAAHNFLGDDSSQSAAVRKRFYKIGRETFGQITIPIITKLALEDRVRVGTFPTNHVMFEDDVSPPYLYGIRLRWDACDETLAHEWGHCIHCWYWPRETAQFSDVPAERLAVWCSKRLGLSPEPNMLQTMARIFYRGA